MRGTLLSELKVLSRAFYNNGTVKLFDLLKRLLPCETKGNGGGNTPNINFSDYGLD